MSHITPIIKTLCVPIHPEGRRFVALFALISLGMFFLWPPLGWAGVILTIWCYYFFRNPPRIVPRVAPRLTQASSLSSSSNSHDVSTMDTLIVSPADGMVQSVELGPWPHDLIQDMPNDGPSLTSLAWRVSIFMSVFDVHVNRSPLDGVITHIVYIPGKFLNASLDKASLDNERQLFLMKDISGRVPLAFTQIAGLIARRITRTTKIGDVFEKGQVFGMIRFGSRVDVFFPSYIRPMICEGQRAISGETVLAQIPDNLPLSSSPSPAPSPLWLGRLTP